MRELRTNGLDQALVEVAKVGRRLLGICLGMQMLVDSSTENGAHVGLGLIPSNVLPIATKQILMAEKEGKCLISVGCHCLPLLEGYLGKQPA